MSNRWEIGEVDALLFSLLSNDAFIKEKLGGVARVSAYRVVRDPNYFPYIYFYCIPGPDGAGQGTRRIQSNPEYAIEVRTIGAPTDDSEAVVNRIDEIVGTMKRQLTPGGQWVVAGRRTSPINIPQEGETSEIFYMRRGGNYKLAVVRA